MTSGTGACPVILGLQLFSMLTQLNILCKLRITINLISIPECADYLNVKPYQKLASNKPACLTHKISLTKSNHKQTSAPLILL